MKKMHTLICCCLTILLGACASKAPEWVFNSIPHKPGIIYAVGTCGPTFFKEDAKECAADSARKELAKNLRVEISTMMLEITENDGSYIDEATVTNVSLWATSLAVEKSNIEGYWYDKEKGMTYALGSVPLGISQSELEQRLSKPVESEKNNEDANIRQTK